MAKSIGKSILSNTSHHNKPGGRVANSNTVSRTKNRGNKGSFGGQKQSTKKSINSGGNYGPIGY